MRVVAANSPVNNGYIAASSRHPAYFVLRIIIAGFNSIFIFFCLGANEHHAFAFVIKYRSLVKSRLLI